MSRTQSHSQWAEVNAMVASLTKTGCMSKLAGSSLGVKLLRDDNRSGSGHGLHRKSLASACRSSSSAGGRHHEDVSEATPLVGGETCEDTSGGVKEDKQEGGTEGQPVSHSRSTSPCEEAASVSSLMDDNPANSGGQGEVPPPLHEVVSGGNHSDDFTTENKWQPLPLSSGDSEESSSSTPLVSCYGLPQRLPPVSRMSLQKKVLSAAEQLAPQSKKEEDNSSSSHHIGGRAIRPGSSSSSTRAPQPSSPSSSPAFSLLRKMAQEVSRFDYKEEGSRLPNEQERPGSAPVASCEGYQWYDIVQEVRRQCREGGREVRVPHSAAGGEGGANGKRRGGGKCPARKQVCDRLHEQSLQSAHCAGEHLRRLSRPCRRLQSEEDGSAAPPERRRRRASASSSPPRRRMPRLDMEEHYLLDREWRDALGGGRGTEWRRQMDREAEEGRELWREQLRQRASERRAEEVASHSRHKATMAKQLRDNHERAQKMRTDLDDAVDRMYKEEEDRIESLQHQIREGKKNQSIVPLRLRWETPPLPHTGKCYGTSASGALAHWKLLGSVEGGWDNFEGDLSKGVKPKLLSTADEASLVRRELSLTPSQLAAERIYRKGAIVPPSAPFGSFVERLPEEPLVEDEN